MIGKRAVVLCTLAIALCALVLWVPKALAVGTPAGTIISNQAYVDYKDANGNAMTRVLSNWIRVTVSPVYAISIVPPTDAKTGANNNTVMYLAQIFNYGNTPDPATFTYTVESGWTPTSVTFRWDANANGIYEPGIDTLIGTGPGSWSTAAFVPAGTPADAYFGVFMIVGVPDNTTTALYNEISVIQITATSVSDGSKTASGTYTTTVSAAVITGQKTHTPVSPKPGDTVTYTVALTNTGTSDGTSTVVSDLIPTNMTYLAGSIKTGATFPPLTPKTDATGDADGGYFSANTVTADAGTIASNGTYYVQFQATVNANVPSGTSIINQASIQYSTTGGNTYTVQTNVDTFFVAMLAGVSLESDKIWYKNPGDQVVSPFVVTNNGNQTDKFNLTYTSSAGWNYAFWVDVDANGIPGTGGDSLLIDSNGDGIIDTGALAQNGTLAILAVTTVPAGTADHTVDYTVVTGKSINNPAVSDVENITTTVTAPTLDVTKTVSPTGNQQPPGTVLTYTVTVTNIGSGTATSVIITDAVPQNTTYVTESIFTGATVETLVHRTDSNNGDGGRYDSLSNSVIIDSGSSLTIGSGGRWILRFQVTIN